jgi:hypothetical protein
LKFRAIQVLYSLAKVSGKLLYQNHSLAPIHKWLFSAISMSDLDFNPRNTTMYSCG